MVSLQHHQEGPFGKSVTFIYTLFKLRESRETNMTHNSCIDAFFQDIHLHSALLSLWLGRVCHHGRGFPSQSFWADMSRKENVFTERVAPVGWHWHWPGQ